MPGQPQYPSGDPHLSRTPDCLDVEPFSPLQSLKNGVVFGLRTRSPDNSVNQAGWKQKPPKGAWTLHRETCCFKTAPSPSAIGHTTAISTREATMKPSASILLLPRPEDSGHLSNRLRATDQSNDALASAWYQILWSHQKGATPSTIPSST